MNDLDFDNFCEDVNSYLHSKILPKGSNVEDLLLKINALNSSQADLLKRKLAEERYHILDPDPVSFPPYILLILQHSAEALKRACFVSCLTMITHYSLAENFSVSSTLTRGMLTGLTTFGISILFDGIKSAPQNKMSRIYIFQKELNEKFPESVSFQQRIKFA